MATTRPVLTGNNISLILGGLDLLLDQHQQMAEEFARSQDYEMAGLELSVVTDTQELRGRMLDLMNTLIDATMAEGMDEMSEVEEDGFVTDPSDLDEVGTIPLPEPTEE